MRSQIEENSDSARTKGWSLVEVLVAMTLLSVAIALTLSVLLNVQKTKTKIEKKYVFCDEVDHIADDMAHTLSFAQRLLCWSHDTLLLLDISNDTISYYVKDDTLFRNGELATHLRVEYLHFSYIMYENNAEIADFYGFDSDQDGVVSNQELNAASGIRVHMKFSEIQRPALGEISCGRNFFVRFRNICK